MNSPFISANVLNTLGLPVWQSRPGQFSVSQKPEESDLSSYIVSDDDQSDAIHVEEDSSIVDYASSLAENEFQRVFIFLGAGLNTIWQNEDRPEWQLFLNILSAFNLSEDQARFFDTGQLVTEEAIFATLDEIIELGVEQVFAFDETGPLLQELSEGAQIVVMPSFDDLLNLPRAKRDFYHLMIAQLT
ncbi:MAG: hypothetical protein HUJ13_06145 [Hydrogenovibrio crunogenus]|uniref:Uncharacterized protein n=1 Tax=Hydrogenovibrio crunogenus (strain DSM 25203 / XCL-2) TaxID=317025 RepID=Q31I15_HYDCU|nr:hypothetical protein [Hydrogenovibrio crunogenus]